MSAADLIISATASRAVATSIVTRVVIYGLLLLFAIVYLIAARRHGDDVAEAAR